MKRMQVTHIQRGPFSNMSVSPYYYSETIRNISLPQKGTNPAQEMHCVEKVVGKSSSSSCTKTIK